MLLTSTELQLVSLLRGPKLSDKQIGGQLGLAQDESIKLYHSLRTKLGVNPHRESLRDFVRRNPSLGLN